MRENVAVVTGANGFIGKNLVGLLIEKGYKVAAVPRELLNSPDGLVIFLESAKPTHIFHLASYGNHVNQTEDDEIFGTNIVKTYLLLRASLAVDYRAFINFSSSSVYGIKDKPMNEADLPETNSFYGITKLSAEYLCRAFAKKYNRPIVSVRPFSVFGPGEAEHRFIPSAIKAIDKGLPYTLYSDPVHDWVYIEDLLNAVFSVAENIHQCKSGVVNIGTSKQHSNQEVFENLLYISGKKHNPVIKRDGRDYDSGSWRADTSLITSLGWHPKQTLMSGLEKTYNWFTNGTVEPTLQDAIDKSLDMLGQGNFTEFDKLNEE